MEEGVKNRNYKKNGKYDEEKDADKTTEYDSIKIAEGKEVIYERGGKDVDLITEGSIVCVNNNKTVWEGREM